MTEKLTIKDLNCDNCTIEHCPIMVSGGNFKPISGGYSEIDNAIKHCGCASHPLALQVLAAPVIEELENRQKQCDWDYGDECAYGHTAFGDAIKLLKEGVKKP